MWSKPTSWAQKRYTLCVVYRVLPGDPDNSYLIQKMEDTQLVGNWMPPSGGLNQAIINDIRLWITNGALRQ